MVSFRKIKCNNWCSARDWAQDRITWGNPQKWCSDSLPYLKGHYRCTRSLCCQVQTPVWSESSVDEHNLYFARSAIIGYLAVETWRIKTELMIITILHIIIITASILNLGFKTFAPKIMSHTTCINRYWKYTQIFAAKNQSKTYCKNRQNLLRKNKTGQNLLQKIIKYWRLPKIIIYTQKKYSRPIKIYAHILKYLLTCKIFPLCREGYFLLPFNE